MNNLKPPMVYPDFNINLFNIDNVKLSNGLGCFYIQNQNTDIVKFSYVFKAGDKYGNAAVVKILSQVIFDGSLELQGEKFAEKIDSHGAYVFAKESPDRLIFSLVCQKKHLDEVLSVFNDAIFQPEFEQDKINIASYREANNLAEAFQYNSTIADDIFSPSILGDKNPYGKVLHPEDFQNMLKEEIISFHQKYINIDNAYVLVSGDLSNDDKNQVNAALEKLNGNGFVATEIKLPVNNNEPALKYIRNPYSSQSYVLLGCQSIAKKHPDYINFKIVSTLLGGYIGSRLMQNIREKSGYTYDIFASLVSYEQAAIFRIASEIQNGSEEKVLIEIKNEIERLKSELISNEELTRLKNYLSGELLNAFDGMFARDSSFLSVHNFGLDIRYYQLFLESVKNLNNITIQSIANKYLNIDNFTQIVVQAENDTKD